MAVKLVVPGFSVEGETTEECAFKVARHFGCIADGVVPDAGVAIGHTVETVEEA